jgi:hypothetical protein
MRSARPVGLSQDGSSLIVATQSGEELTIAVDEQLHAVLRGDRPRLGQLEIEMDQALGPRDIQARIRAGQSLQEVARVAGIPLDRVERFAAPVLAEREHVALVALSSSVRRRGETSGHRVLRLAAGERLQQRGVHPDTVDWNASKREDGRWSVTADYQSGEARRQAVFAFDLRGRFSMADNDEARWLLSEQSALKGPQPGRRRPAGEGADGPDEGTSSPDTEPTLDLSDELALVRVIQPPAGEVSPAETDDVSPLGAGEASRPAGHVSRPVARGGARGLHAVPDQPSSRPEDPREQDEPEDAEDHPESDHAVADQARDQDTSGMDEAAAESQLDVLDRMLDGAVDPAAAYGGLSDASAVPVTDLGGWEPGLVVNYPVEPGPEPGDQADEPEPADQTGSATPPEPPAQTGPVEQTRAHEQTRTDEPVERPEQSRPQADEEEPAHPVPEPSQQPATPVRPAARRKRASVPSWDEIMFGGPTPPS